MGVVSGSHRRLKLSLTDTEFRYHEGAALENDGEVVGVLPYAMYAAGGERQVAGPSDPGRSTAYRRFIGKRRRMKYRTA